MTFLLPEAPFRSLDDYLASGGGQGLARATEFGPAAVIEEIDRSGLRGRGGAGFPTGRKWRSVAAQTGSAHFVVANGAEGEPGTFKDRTLLRANPYAVVEGLMIAGFAVGATSGFIALKASFEAEREAVLRAATEMQQAGLCPDCPVNVVSGPEEYLFGEEKALLEVIEGRPPLPRLLPPYEHGLYATAPQTGWQAAEAAPGQQGRQESNPTLVNNVETLADAAFILARGADWFRSMGTEASPGTLLCTVVGDTVRAGVAEVAMGTPLRRVIDEVGGGVAPGRRVKAVFSGVSNPVITEAQLDTPLTYEDLAAIGSGLGAGGYMVFDDSACMVAVAELFSRFLWVESCGQCPPCKLGSGHITRLLAEVENGHGVPADVEELGGWLRRVTDGNRCYLAVQEQQLVASVLAAFGHEVEEHLTSGRCPRPRRLRLPKLVEVADGTAIYDERQASKNPDWTYADEPAG